jgi:hypothetical protein
VERALAVPDVQEVSLVLGEQLVAGATVLGVSVGTLDMRLSEKCRGKEGAWSLESKLNTAGVARWFDKTEGNTTTLVDSATLLPVESTTVVISGDEWRRYHIQFGSGSYHYYQTRSNGDRKEGEVQSPESESIYDTQTAYLLLRTWQPKPGEQSYFYVVLGKDLWRADVTYTGKVHLDTDDGRVKTRHVKGLAHRINLEPGDEYTPRALELWLSDDEIRVPLKVVGDGSVGPIEFSLSKRAVLEACPEAATEAPPLEPTSPSAPTNSVDATPPAAPPSSSPPASTEAVPTAAVSPTAAVPP